MAGVRQDYSDTVSQYSVPSSVIDLGADDDTISLSSKFTQDLNIDLATEDVGITSRRGKRQESANDEEDDEGEDGDNIVDQVEWGCAYCGIHNPSSVVKCLVCNKWFCNSKVGTSGR